MPDVGWQELLVIAVVAVIVVGPRELPKMMRTLGRWMASARRTAREFQNSMEELGREVELEDLRKEIGDFRKPMDLGSIEKPPVAKPADPAKPVT